MTQQASEQRQLSRVVGAKTPPLREQTTDAALRDAAQLLPEREALVSVAEGVKPLVYCDKRNVRDGKVSDPAVSDTVVGMKIAAPALSVSYPWQRA